MLSSSCTLLTIFKLRFLVFLVIKMLYFYLHKINRTQLFLFELLTFYDFSSKIWATLCKTLLPIILIQSVQPRSQKMIKIMNINIKNCCSSKAKIFLFFIESASKKGMNRLSLKRRNTQTARNPSYRISRALSTLEIRDGWRSIFE